MYVLYGYSKTHLKFTFEKLFEFYIDLPTMFLSNKLNIHIQLSCT